MLDAEISGCRLRETGCRHQASRGLWGLRGRPVRSGKVVPAGRLLEALAKLPETIACRMTLSLRRARHPVCVKGGSCDVIPLSRNAHRCVAAIPFRSANLITCTRTILSAEPIILRNLVATPLCPDSRIMPSSDPLTQLWFPAGLKGCFRPRSCGVLCSKSAA